MGIWREAQSVPLFDFVALEPFSTTAAFFDQRSFSELGSVGCLCVL